MADYTLKDRVVKYKKLKYFMGFYVGFISFCLIFFSFFSLVSGLPSVRRSVYSENLLKLFLNMSRKEMLNSLLICSQICFKTMLSESAQCACSWLRLKWFAKVLNL